MGVLALVWLVGGYAIVAGVLYLALAYRADGPMPPKAVKDVHAERRVAGRRMTPAGQH